MIRQTDTGNLSDGSCVFNYGIIMVRISLQQMFHSSLKLPTKAEIQAQIQMTSRNYVHYNKLLQFPIETKLRQRLSLQLSHQSSSGQGSHRQRRGDSL